MDLLSLKGAGQASPPVVSLRSPLSEAGARALGVGTITRLSGRLYTARDQVHRRLHASGKAPVDLKNAGIFHCGPVVAPDGNGGWRVSAAGPTTSMRAEPYMDGIIARFGIRLIVGKGGMGKRTVEACRKHGCVYLQAAGGAAAWLAQTVKAVSGVWFLEEFGTTEAMWALDVEGLEAVVTIDAGGRSLYEDVAAESRRALERVLAGSPFLC